MAWIGEAASGSLPFLMSDGSVGTVAPGTNGQFLAYSGNNILWATPNITFSGAIGSGTATKTLTTNEQALASGLITPSNASAKILVIARSNVLKDTGTTARTVTALVRAGPQVSNRAVSLQCVVRSQGVASSAFGPVIMAAIDSPGSTNPTGYFLYAKVDAGSPTCTAYEVTAIEI